MSPDRQTSNNSYASKGRSIRIKNLPENVSKDEIEKFVSSHVPFEKIINVRDGACIVVFDNSERTQKAYSSLSCCEFDNSVLEVEYLSENKNQNSRIKDSPYPNSYNKPSKFTTDTINGAARIRTGYPVRIMVASELVGAIIGKKGSVIRNITTQYKTRVDVHGRENSRVVEKIISIYGQPENCTKALREILNIIQQESSSSNQGTVVLKMLADDRYCGRIIGKEGKIVKKIKEETDTKITISNMQEMRPIYPDRIIAIRGTVDNMAKAQASITQKLNEFILKDQQYLNNKDINGAYLNNSNIQPLLYGMGKQSQTYPLKQNSFSTTNNYGLGHGCGNTGQFQSLGNSTEMCQIIVPNSIVGAIIGSGGSIIKQIMQDSNAHVTVEPKHSEDEANNSGNIERTVTIRGSTDACWKASYFIFEKVRSEDNSGSGIDDRLKTLISVPSSIIGHMISRNGKNIREIQRVTGAVIKVLGEDDITPNRTTDEEMLIEVFGNFMATQGAHNRIRALVSSLNNPILLNGVSNTSEGNINHKDYINGKNYSNQVYKTSLPKDTQDYNRRRSYQRNQEI